MIPAVYEMQNMVSMHRIIRAILVLGLVVACQVGAAATYYVNPAGNDTNDGASWATAKLTIQAVIDVATTDDVVVATIQSFHQTNGLVFDGAAKAGESSVTNAVSQVETGTNVTVALSETPVAANQPPALVLAVNPLSGSAPLRVTFDFKGSIDPDGTIAKCGVDKTGDEVNDVEGAGDGKMTVVYGEPGTFRAGASVTDNSGAVARTNVVITVTKPPSGKASGR